MTEQNGTGYKKNLFIEFQQNSTDFLKVLGDLSGKADQRKPIQIQHKDLVEMCSTMELFWDITEKIFMEYEAQLHIVKLRAATDHMLLGAAEAELRKAYNAMFQMSSKYKDPEILQKLLKLSMIPTKKELEEYQNKDLVFKVPDEQHKENLKTVEQIKKDQQQNPPNNNG